LSLLDANAIIAANIRWGSQAALKIEGRMVTPLTGFEVGNSIWKQTLLIDKRPPEEAVKLVEAASRALLILNVADLSPSEYGHVMEIAAATGRTFYDSSYLYLARRDGLKLITLDRKLQKAAKQVGVDAADLDALDRE
jgi:predicted nucleic acid-binding protein